LLFFAAFVVVHVVFKVFDLNQVNQSARGNSDVLETLLEEIRCDDDLLFVLVLDGHDALVAPSHHKLLPEEGLLLETTFQLLHGVHL
jgi:hypothetical protein